MEKQVIISLEEYLEMKKVVEECESLLEPIAKDIGLIRTDYIANPETMFAGYKECLTIDRDTMKYFLNRVKGTDGLDFTFR